MFKVLIAFLILTSCATPPYHRGEFTKGKPVEIRIGALGNGILLQEDNKIVLASDIRKETLNNATANEYFKAGEMAENVVMASMFVWMYAWLGGFQNQISGGKHYQQFYDIGTVALFGVAMPFAYYADWKNSKGAEEYNKMLKEKETLSPLSFGIQHKKDMHSIVGSWSF